MKAIISSTYDDKYLYFIPIVTWLWNKLGVDVICFMPIHQDPYNCLTGDLVIKTIIDNNLKCERKYFFAPKHKEATYAQCSRLYGACLDFPEDEVLITSDVDMGVFKLQPNYYGSFHIHGWDLTPPKQYPICYIKGHVASWRGAFNINNRSYQQCLDDLLGDIEAEHFRGNYWGKDQEEAYNKISNYPTLVLEQRARPGTQFAANRVDRDDINWRAYVNDELIDAHLWRPGYTDENFANIIELLTMKYPQEDFAWLVNYTNEYKKLL